MRAVSSSTPSIQPKTGAKLRPAAFRLAWGKGFVLPVMLILLWQLVGSFGAHIKNRASGSFRYIAYISGSYRIRRAFHSFRHQHSARRARLFPGGRARAPAGACNRVFENCRGLPRSFSANAENRSASRRHAAVYLMVRFR